MLVGKMTIFEKTLNNILDGTMQGYISQGLSAHLMVSTFVPLVETQYTFVDISSAEVTGQDYLAKSMTGIAVTVSNGNIAISSDPIVFGNPITLPLFRYLVLASGLPGASAATKKLVAYADLATGGGAREVVRGALVFNHGADGWFAFSQA